MTIALGAESYVAFGMQTAFGSAVAPSLTLSHLRTGQPTTPRQGKQPRISTSRVIPGADQLWNTMKLADFDYEFEVLGTAAAWLPWLRGAFAHELKAGAGPVTHTYNIQNPPVDPTTADTATDFYNRALTLRHTLASNGTSIATYETRDCCIQEFFFSCEANSTARFGFSGTGQNYQTASAIAYAEPAGTTLAWEHFYATANGGIYSGAANPPTTAMPVRSFKYTLNNNLRFMPFLGTGSGLELKKPSRNGFPTMTLEVLMDFDDDSSTDAVSIMSDFIAATTHNVRIEGYIDANNGVELLASAATKPGVLADPKINVVSEGVVEFGHTVNIFPAASTTDAKLVLTTAT